MFEYTFIDWLQIALLLSFASIPIYVILVIFAKLFAGIFRYNFSKEWPPHTVVIPSFLLLTPMVIALSLLFDKTSGIAKEFIDNFLSTGDVSFLHLIVFSTLGCLFSAAWINEINEEDQQVEKTEKTNKSSLLRVSINWLVGLLFLKFALVFMYSPDSIKNFVLTPIASKKELNRMQVAQREEITQEIIDYEDEIRSASDDEIDVLMREVADTVSENLPLSISSTTIYTSVAYIKKFRLCAK